VSDSAAVSVRYGRKEESQSRDVLASVQSVKVTSNTTHNKKDTEITAMLVQFKLHGKLRACQELLDRWLGKPKQAVDVKSVVGVREVSEAEMAKLMTDVVIPCEDAIAH